MAKLCNDQLTEKLVGLFEEAADPDNIDTAVAQAKDCLEQKTKQTKRSDLEKLFDSQIATLKNRGCPEAIVEMLQNQCGEVIAKASKMTFEKGRTPFLPVIPRVYLTIYSQMAMVRNGSKAGFTYLDPAEIADLVKTPSKPFYIFNVEDGTAMLGKAPEDAENLIKKQNGRRGLTEVEVIALCVHTNVLSRHYVDATGSRYGRSRDDVPGLYLYAGRPRLDWYYVDRAYPCYGAASCGE